MTAFEPVAPPAWAEAAADERSVLDSVSAWVDNEALAALVAAFGERIPTGRDTGAKLAWLDGFSADHWDFRQGQERNLAAAAAFEEPTTAVILAAAAGLGLTSSTPPARDRYDHVLILGGLVRACLLRPRYAADLIGKGLSTPSVAALSAYRPLRGDEHELIAALGMPGKSNEMQVMEAGLTAAFDLGTPDSEQAHHDPAAEYATSLVRTWTEHGTRIQLVIAPSPEPTERRANTADTYAFWADTQAQLSAGQTLLLVTSSIYVPYQHADAVRLLALPHRCSVETVGIDFADHALGTLRQQFTPANYLQEVRSAIRGTRTLFEAASATLASGR